MVGKWTDKVEICLRIASALEREDTLHASVNHQNLGYGIYLTLFSKEYFMMCTAVLTFDVLRYGYSWVTRIGVS